MRCHEVRRFIGPYLDSELDARTSLEIEQHLENCSECARVFEAEKKLDARMFSVLRQGEKTFGLWEAAEKRVAPVKRLLRFKAFWPLAAAASLVLLAGGVVLAVKTHTIDLAIAVEECHDEYVRKLHGVQFTGAVPEEIKKQFGGRLDTAAFSFRPLSGGFSARGARFCRVQTVPAAVILGDYENLPVSLIVLKSSELEHFPKLKKRFVSGHSVVCSRAGRYQFAARVVDGHVVCIVGDAPRPELEALLKTVVKQG
jgi:anti-sigma factor RsiW